MTENTGKIIVPPIKCQGIKTKLADWILSCVKFEKGQRWVEPFAGSCVVGFNLQPENALFADTNPHIINFYNAVKFGEITSKIARDFLEFEGDKLSKNGESHFYTVRERFNETKNSLDFLFINRACFNGLMRFNRKGFFNVPSNRKPERFAKAYISKICNQIEKVEKLIKLNNWYFVCQDYRKTIGETTENDWIYCDSPYFGRHADYFNNWTETEEQDLFELLKKTKAKFVYSTWHSNRFRENIELEKYSKNFEVLTKEHFYHVGASENNRNSMLEAVVLNYQRQNVKTAKAAFQQQLFN